MSRLPTGIRCDPLGYAWPVTMPRIRVVRDVLRARWDRDAGSYPLLIVLKFTLLGWCRDTHSQLFVGPMSLLLGIKAFLGMELKLKHLAVHRDSPSGVDSFVLLLVP